MSTVIEARVIQKVDTEANWMNNTLPLYSGEVAFVSDKNNFKLNFSNVPRRFSELEYYYKGDIIGGVKPTDDLSAKATGVYRAEVSGTYAEVVVKEGYYTLLRKLDNGIWVLESETKMPMQDLTPLENQITEIDTKVDDFIDNYVPPIATEFDVNNNSESASMKATSEFFGITDTVVKKPFGVTLVGNQDTEIGSAGGILITNTQNTATEDLTISSIVTNFTVAGQFKVSITDSNNNIIYTSETLTAGTGSVSNALPNIVVRTGQRIWLTTILGSTARCRYGENNISGNFIQRQVNGSLINGVGGSYYSFYFTYDVLENKGVLGDYVKKGELNGYEDSNDLTTYGNSIYTDNIGYQSTTAIYILKAELNSQKAIKELNFSCNRVGQMTFVIGSLDQENRFIEDRSFVVDVVNGVNNIKIDETIEQGQYLGVKTPGLMPNIDTLLRNDLTWGIEGNYTSPLFKFTGWSLSLSFSAVTRVITGEPFVRKNVTDNLQNQINNIQVSNIWKSPNGENWKVSVNNEGEFVSERVGVYNTILHYGNSILKHDIVSYWWGNWGMAASSRETDYAHRFLSKIKIANLNAQSWEQNIATWEQNPSGFNKSSLDPLLTAREYDLIIVRLGENATSIDASTYKTEFANLITYIQGKVPTARVVIGGMFWTNVGLDNAMREVAQEKGLTFAEMSGLNTPEYKSFIGDVVQGDDGQSHIINNQGVADHPNDTGMEAIADRLFNAVNS